MKKSMILLFLVVLAGMQIQRQMRRTFGDIGQQGKHLEGADLVVT